MVAEDVTDTLNLALQASGCDRATTNYTPRRLSSDDASNYVSADLAGSLDDHGMEHVRRTAYYPQTQGKVECWHQTLKKCILLEDYYLPGAPSKARSPASSITKNHRRYHESINNLTLADVYFRRGQSILKKRERK